MHIYVHIYIHIYMHICKHTHTYICHRHGKGIWKRDDEVWTLPNIWDCQCGCWQMCRQTMVVPLHMCSGFSTERLEQMIVTSLYDVMRVSHATVGGNYKKEHDQALGLLLLSSGCFNTSVWVFSKPHTLYFGCLSAPRVGSISRIHSVVCFFHKHVSRPIWRTLSCCDFICLMATGQTTTSYP